MNSDRLDSGQFDVIKTRMEKKTLKWTLNKRWTTTIDKRDNENDHTVES